MLKFTRAQRLLLGSGLGILILAVIFNAHTFQVPNSVYHTNSLDASKQYKVVNDSEMRTAIEQIDVDPNHHERHGYTQIAITSHHIPIAANFIAEVYNRLLDTEGPRQTFVVIGPDHFERCPTRVTIHARGFATSFGTVAVDDTIAAKLVNAFAREPNDCLASEHSISTQAPFIAHAFPDARIVGITLSASTTEHDLAQLAAILAEMKDTITIVASTDFSHYLPLAEARSTDAASARMIESLDASAATSKNIDSVATLRLVIAIAKLWHLSPTIIDEKNLFDITGQSDNTTGYINAVFTDPAQGDTTTVGFVGDVMLSRSVGQKIVQENDFSWPFRNVADQLQRYDLLFGNLEGSLSSRGTDGGSVYSFRADPRTVAGLVAAGFDAMSVANNHIADWGKDAFTDTLTDLKKATIAYVGGGSDEEDAHRVSVIKRNGIRFGFLGYTAVGSTNLVAHGSDPGIARLDEPRMKADIAHARDLVDVLIVSIHFGDEYKTHSNALQEHAARAAIDAGADLVIGHHPHVVEEVEEYKNGLIAYSLGNFVFDQTFSEETRNGALLEIVYHGSNRDSYRLVPTYISDAYQAGITL